MLGFGPPMKARPAAPPMPLRAASVAVAAAVAAVPVAWAGEAPPPRPLPPTLEVRPATLRQGMAGFSVGMRARKGDRRLFSEIGRDRLDLPAVSGWVELASRIGVEAEYSFLMVRYGEGADADPKNPVADGVGSGDVTLRVRVGVLRGGERWPALALGTSVKLPNATDRDGFGTDETDVWIHALVGARGRRWQLHGNLDFGILGEPTKRAAQDDVFGGGVAAEVDVGDGLGVAVELTGRLPSSANPGEATLRFAFSGPLPGGPHLSFGPEVSLIDGDLALGVRLDLWYEGWPLAGVRPR